MHRAESKISPVVAAFKDQVLFLKHNLNAQAIAAVEHEFIEISMDMTQLVQAMEQTIFEANRFIAGLVDQKALPASRDTVIKRLSISRAVGKMVRTRPACLPIRAVTICKVRRWLYPFYRV